MLINNPLLLKNNGFDFICKKIENRAKKRFCFLKNNHGFWEQLVKIGFEEKYINSYIHNFDEKPYYFPPKDYADHIFLKDGFLKEIILIMENYLYEDQKKGLYFVPSLTPWPFSREILGVPFQNKNYCESLIKHIINPKIIDENSKIGFTGHEFKLAVIQNKLNDFLIKLKEMNIMFVGNKDHFEVLSKLDLNINNYIEIPSSGSHQLRNNILQRINGVLVRKKLNCDYLILISAGGAVTTWLGFKLFYDYKSLNIVDIGGLFEPLTNKNPLGTDWGKFYFNQVYINTNKKIQKEKNFKEAYENFIFDSKVKEVCSRYSKVFPKLIINYQNQAEKSTINKLKASYSNFFANSITRRNNPIEDSLKNKISFIENKSYDFEFIQSLLELSTKENWHANGGPVVRLLEKSLHSFLSLPENKTIICTNSGTSALQVACGLIQQKYNQNKDPNKLMKWVTCGFNFVSAFTGPLTSTIKIDCTKNGLFSVDELRKIPSDKYDGVIYTNTFTQHSKISELVAYCEANNKFIVVDNATGLVDRCVDNEVYIPEIISLHHTKPWGFGEGGAIICNSSDEILVRKLINFGASKIEPIYSIYSGNKKLSDIAASAILFRLATYNQWSNFYLGQEKRIKSIISDYSLPLKPLNNKRKTKSPLAYTPFVLESKINEEALDKSVNITFRKYYRPYLYGSEKNARMKLPNAYELYDRILCISNNPENSLKSESEIISDLNKLGVVESNN